MGTTPVVIKDTELEAKVESIVAKALMNILQTIVSSPTAHKNIRKLIENVKETVPDTVNRVIGLAIIIPSGDIKTFSRLLRLNETMPAPVVIQLGMGDPLSDAWLAVESRLDPETLELLPSANEVTAHEN